MISNKTSRQEYYGSWKCADILRVVWGHIELDVPVSEAETLGLYPGSDTSSLSHFGKLFLFCDPQVPKL